MKSVDSFHFQNVISGYIHFNKSLGQLYVNRSKQFDDINFNITLNIYTKLSGKISLC